MSRDVTLIGLGCDLAHMITSPKLVGGMVSRHRLCLVSGYISWKMGLGLDPKAG